MKIFKFLAMLTISVLLFTGCEKEEITNYAFQEISAPTNVQANFVVAQDDSGDVTITPSGEGAQVFQVYFGDGDDTPVEVAQGESVSYTYGEGEYLVRVIAVGSTGLTSEFNQRLLISFKAPENLEVTVTQSASNPALVSVSATADFAATFDVYFGDAEDEEPTQLMPDGSIDHTYAARGTYTIRVVAKGAGVATTETTVDVVVPEANDPVKLPITYDEPTVNYALGTFNGATFEVVTNPFLSGANTEETMVGALTNAGANFEGGAYNLGEPVDFNGNNKTISMKVYSDKPVAVLLKFEGGATDADRANEVSADHGGTGWEVLTFDFGTDALKSFIEGDPGNFTPFVPTGKYSTLVLFVEIGKTTKGTFYFDDIMKAGDGPVASTKTSFPVNFETAANGGATANWSVFENVDNPPLEIVSNPNATGANTSATVAKFIARQGGQPFAGTITQLQTPFTLSASNSIVKILVWKTVISDVGIKFENASGGSTGEVKVANTKVNEWEELTFDFSSAIGKPENTNITGLVVFPDFNARTQETVNYFDNIRLTDGDGGTSGGTDPTAAAPTPTLAAANVISMFSDAYTDVPVDTWKTSWSASNYEEKAVAGNATKYYSNLDFVGIETVSNQIDASSMTHFHLDYWTGNATVFRVKLVDFGADGGFQGGDDTEGQIEFTVTPNTWVSLDIPLADFTTLTNKKNIAQLILSAAPAGAANVYVDNVYFHN